MGAWGRRGRGEGGSGTGQDIKLLSSTQAFSLCGGQWLTYASPCLVHAGNAAMDPFILCGGPAVVHQSMHTHSQDRVVQRTAREILQRASSHDDRGACGPDFPTDDRSFDAERVPSARPGDGANLDSRRPGAVSAQFMPASPSAIQAQDHAEFGHGRGDRRKEHVWEPSSDDDSQASDDASSCSETYLTESGLATCRAVADRYLAQLRDACIDRGDRHPPPRGSPRASTHGTEPRAREALEELESMDTPSRWRIGRHPVVPDWLLDLQSSPSPLRR